MPFCGVCESLQNHYEDEHISLHHWSELEFAIDSASELELGFEPDVDYDAEPCMPIPHEPHDEYPYDSCPGFIGPEVYRLSEEYQSQLEETDW